MHECLYYEMHPGEPPGEAPDQARCRLCPFFCRIEPDANGRCGARGLRQGKLVALNYGQVAAVALDPIEKKPLYHFRPGSSILSLGTFGCNLTCGFCQNWHLSRELPPTRDLSPEEAVASCLQQRRQGNIGIAYTYNEPFVWYEYVADTARLVRKAGMCNVLVTNGIIEPAPLEALLGWVDALNVDIKSIRESFYRKLCGGDGRAALRTVERAVGRCHVEITNLIIPGENDSEEGLRDLFIWAAGISRRLPLHLSAYHPAHKMTAPATSAQTLRRAYELAREYLDFVYVGNLNLPGTTDTHCPRCGTVAVERSGYDARVHTRDGRCPGCQEDLGIVT
jgi:pyruvate formate lyase activating enzyme